MEELMASHFVSFGFINETEQTEVYTIIYGKEEDVQQVDQKHFEKTIKSATI